jgi:hypothetical protein
LIEKDLVQETAELMSYVQVRLLAASKAIEAAKLVLESDTDCDEGMPYILAAYTSLKVALESMGEDLGEDI